MGLTIHNMDISQIHRYNNIYSRQCTNMGVPYQYSGFLFDSIQKNVYDQVRNLDLYPVTYWGYRSQKNQIKLGNFLKVGDSIVQHYQQGYLRCEVSKITSHKNIYVQRWTEEWNYISGQDLINKGYVTDPYNPKDWIKFTDINHYAPDRFWNEITQLKTLQKGEDDLEIALKALKDGYFQNPIAGQIREPRTADRQWRLYNCDLYAIPKERALYLKIQE